VRILHPQRFSDAVWRLLSVFEGFWTSAVGCNAYLTPPHSQGFAPHWDDIDAFILQGRPPHDTRLSPPPPP
jgi:lysine-specific demethylase/histidyl-hydroxylase NO66